MPGYVQWPPLCHNLILRRRWGWSTLSALCFPHDHWNQGSIKETRVRCSSVTLSLFGSWRSHLRKLVPSSGLFWPMVCFLVFFFPLPVMVGRFCLLRWFGTVPFIPAATSSLWVAVDYFQLKITPVKWCYESRPIRQWRFSVNLRMWNNVISF